MKKKTPKDRKKDRFEKESKIKRVDQKKEKYRKKFYDEDDEEDDED
ncbi:hypothetical protein [Halocola ammonii]